MKVLALHNLKGGVGKTTTAVHLAHLAARAGHATLLWDLDAQGASSWILRVRVGADTRPRRLLRDRANLWEAIRGSDWPNLDVLPADLSLRNEKWPRARRPARASHAARGPPAATNASCSTARLGLSSLTECVFEAADALAVPTIPSTRPLRAQRALPAPEAQRERGRATALLLDARRAQGAAPRGARFVRRRDWLPRDRDPVLGPVENTGQRACHASGLRPATRRGGLLRPGGEIEARPGGRPGPETSDACACRSLLRGSEARAAQRNSVLVVDLASQPLALSDKSARAERVLLQPTPRGTRA
jgi:hypothetical protein